MIFKVIIVILLIWLCLLVRRTNDSLFFIYELLKDMKRTEESIFNHVKYIEDDLDNTNT